MGVRLSKPRMHSMSIKVWGHTQSLYIDDKVHVATAFLRKGGFSSRHKHIHIWNKFVVNYGELLIIAYRNGQEERIILRAGQTLDLEPRLEHRMVAMTDCSILEIYWAEIGKINPSDIERFDNGGSDFSKFPLDQTKKDDKITVDIENPSKNIDKKAQQIYEQIFSEYHKRDIKLPTDFPLRDY